MGVSLGEADGLGATKKVRTGIRWCGGREGLEDKSKLEGLQSDSIVGGNCSSVTGKKNSKRVSGPVVEKFKLSLAGNLGWKWIPGRTSSGLERVDGQVQIPRFQTGLEVARQ